MMIPLAQQPDGITRLWQQFGPVSWLIRTRIEPHQVTMNVAEQLREASGGLPAGRVRTMDEVLSQSIARQNFNMLLLGVFAMTALALTAVGIYGVMAYSVTQRTHEIGIRMAVGAQRSDVVRMILRQGLTLAATGIAIGLLLSFALIGFLKSLLFGVRDRDPFSFAVVVIVLIGAAVLACYVPARRAAKVDPMVALRYE